MIHPQTNEFSNFTPVLYKYLCGTVRTRVHQRDKILCSKFPVKVQYLVLYPKTSHWGYGKYEGFTHHDTWKVPSNLPRRIPICNASTLRDPYFCAQISALTSGLLWSGLRFVTCWLELCYFVDIISEWCVIPEIGDSPMALPSVVLIQTRKFETSCLQVWAE